MSHPAYETALYGWVRGCVEPFDTPAPTPPAETPPAREVVVAWADEDAPRPLPPYLTLQVISTRGLGRATRTTRPSEEAESGVEAVLAQRREGILEVQAYGPNHDALMSAVELSIKDSERMDALRAEGVTVERHDLRRRLGLASARVVESRSVTEFAFRYTDTQTAAVTGALATAQTTLQPYTRTGPAQLPPDPPTPPGQQKPPPSGPGPIIQSPPEDDPTGEPFDFTITVPAPEEP